MREGRRSDDMKATNATEEGGIEDEDGVLKL